MLTHHDVSDRGRYLNARHAIDALLSMGVVPIINENDAVSIEELTFGDNDQLAARVCTLVNADLLILLSDVQGVLDDRGERIDVVRKPEDIDAFIKPLKPGDSLGGMGSKCKAAFLATRHGLPAIIGPAANPNVLDDVLNGRSVGTLFLPEGAPLASRKHWIAYTLKSRGELVVDEGATSALVTKNSSLLPAGIVSVVGSFFEGDAVTVVDRAGTPIARGLVCYGADDLRRIAGKKSEKIPECVTSYRGDEAIHRDDLVLLSNAGVASN
ncbi:MAG: glutamate 5-kinase [Polyangiales bacterium]